MPLEAVMIVVDNSESSRNGDYPPTRFDAQADAVGILFQNVIQGNPESSVGLMSMGGKGPEVLVTLTTDQGKIYEGLHRTKKTIRGHAHLATGIQVAGVRSFPFSETILCEMLTGLLFIVGPQAPTEQIPAATDHRLRVLTNRGGRERSGQIGQEDEEEQCIGRLCPVRRRRG
jgi:hypothetical protein